MKILKVYAKNAVNGTQYTILDNINPDIAEKLFLEEIREEHNKICYDMNVGEDIDIDDDDLYQKKWEEKYTKTLDKCEEYAKKWKVNYFGDYEIVLLDDEEGIESPDRIGTYTFYDEMEE